MHSTIRFVSHVSLHGSFPPFSPPYPRPQAGSHLPAQQRGHPISPAKRGHSFSSSLGTPHPLPPQPAPTTLAIIHSCTAALTEIIEALLWEDESTTLDFKQAQYPLTTDEEKSELLKDLVAFTNAFRRDTAYILLGVREHKGGRATITGVTHHLHDHDLQQLVNSKTNRPLTFSYHALTIDHQQVGIIQIPRQPRPAHLTKSFGKLTANTVYLRHGSSTSIATPDEIARMGNDHTERPPSPELTALQAIHEHARFYQRIIRLWESITRIPHHYITNIARPTAYEDERRALHVQFNQEYDTFRQAMSRARDLLTHHRDALAPVAQTPITTILDAVREVEQTVRDLASWSNSRLDTDLPSDKQRDAAAAADTLSNLVAQRLVILGATA